MVSFFIILSVTSHEKGVIRVFDTLAVFCYKSLDPNQFYNESVGWKYIKNADSTKTCYYYKTKNKTRLKYYPLYSMIYIETSCPRMLFGTNVISVYESDMDALSYAFNVALQEAFKSQANQLPPFAIWEVSRIDFCYNLHVPIKAKKFIIELFIKNDLGRLKKKNYDSSSFFNNKSTKYIVYDKHQEIIDHNDEFSMNFKGIENILRFEVGLRRRKIKSKFKTNTKVCHLLKDSIAQNIIEEFIKRAKVKYPLRNKRDTFNLIDKQYKNRKTVANNIKKFLECLNSFGEKTTKEIYSNSTYYKYLKDLSNINVNPLYMENDAIEANISLNIDLEYTRSIESKIKDEILFVRENEEEDQIHWEKYIWFFYLLCMIRIVFYILL